MDTAHKIIVSVSSDIAFELAANWLKNGDKLIGTYRNWNKNLDELSKYPNLTLIKLNFDHKKDFNKLFRLVKKLGKWSVLVIASGRQEPIGNFENIIFSEWLDGVKVNFLDQLKIVHLLLPMKTKKTENGPTVLFFAGGGTNNSVNNYSAYTISKIGLIKMCELLSTEVPNVKFSIVGPGWVKTKIHKPTILDFGNKSEDNYEKTVQMLAGNDCVPIHDVVKSCNWIINQKHEVASGRNFSTKFDKFNDILVNELIKDHNMYKLRRYKNDWL
jgi:short-subunit dehydrogenase